MKRQLIGKDVYDIDHEKVGTISELYIDEKVNPERPTWVSIKTGLMGIKENLVPISLTVPQENEVIVETKKEIITESPDITSGEEISSNVEQRLYEYYANVPGALSTVLAENITATNFVDDKSANAVSDNDTGDYAMYKSK